MYMIFFLSLVQGVTEFIPISSSSHLIILSRYFDFTNNGILLDVSLHIGSFFAVITFFYKDLINFFQNKGLFLKITIASLPVILVGFFLIQSNLIIYLRSVEIIAWMTIIFGILLYVSDKRELQNRIDNNLNYKSSLIIGLFQVLSLIPGVSRSGITITAGRLLKFKRYDTAKISFLLSIPTLGAVSIFGLGKIITSNDINLSMLNFSAILLSFLFSLITIKFFLQFLKKFNLTIFVCYRLILGTILLIIVYL